MKRLNRRARFPHRPWELKYRRALQPKLQARARRIVNRLADSGVIQRFADYLRITYEQGIVRNARLAFDTAADAKVLERLCKTASTEAWSADKLAEEITKGIWTASSKQAFAKLGAKASWNLASPEVLRSIDRRQNLIAGVADSQFARVRDVIRTRCYELGTSPVDSKVISEIRTLAVKDADWQAERIARTEVAAVQSEASYTVYSANGIEQKQWMTTGDDAVRDSHAELEGETVGMDEPFSNGCMYPGDESGEAGEVINCRCVLVPVVSSSLDPDDMDTGE